MSVLIKANDYYKSAVYSPTFAMPLTISAWFRANEVVNANHYIAQLTSTTLTTNNQFRIMASNGGFFSADKIDATSAWAANGDNYYVGRWAHVVGVFASTTSTQIWVNGRLCQTTTLSGNPSTVDTVVIGADYSDSGNAYTAPTNSFSLQDVALWTTALSIGDILTIYKGLRLTEEVQPSSLFGLWFPHGNTGPRNFAGTSKGIELTTTGSYSVSDPPPILLPKLLYVRRDRQQFQYSTYTNSVGDGTGESSSTVPDGLTAYADKVNITGTTKRYVDSTKIATLANLTSYPTNLVFLEEGE